MTFREWRASFAPGAAELWAAQQNPESVLHWVERWLKVYNALVPVWVAVVVAVVFALWGSSGLLFVIPLLAGLILLAFFLLVASQTVTLPVHRALAIALPRVSDPVQIPVLLALLRRIRRHDSGMKSVEIRRTRRAIHQALTRLLPETPSQPAIRSELRTSLASRFRDTESCDPHLIQTVERYLK